MNRAASPRPVNAARRERASECVEVKIGVKSVGGSGWVGKRVFFKQYVPKANYTYTALSGVF